MTSYNIKVVLVYEDGHSSDKTQAIVNGTTARLSEAKTYLKNYNVNISYTLHHGATDLPIHNTSFTNYFKGKGKNLLCNMYSNYGDIESFVDGADGYDILMFVVCGSTVYNSGNSTLGLAFTNESPIFFPGDLMTVSKPGNYYTYHVVAHEILHAIGCSHCSDCDDDDIMGAFIGGESIFSPCTGILQNSPKVNLDYWDGVCCDSGDKKNISYCNDGSQSNFQECQDDGLTWKWISNECPPDQVCTPNEDKCENGTYMKCKSDGSGWTSSSNSSNCKRKKCSGNSCVNMSYSGSPNKPDLCSSSSECGGGATHKECSNGSCITVSGAGANECSSSSQCYHYGCSGNNCIKINSPGADTCNGNADCGGGQTHTECNNGYCHTFAGPGVDECNVNSDCSAPQVCNPNEEKCFSGDLKKCASDGSAWNLKSSNSSHCRYDECDGCSCDPTEYSGTPDSHSDECDDDDDCCGGGCDDTYNVIFISCWDTGDWGIGGDIMDGIDCTSTSSSTSVDTKSSFDNKINDDDWDIIVIIGGQEAWNDCSWNGWSYFFNDVKQNDDNTWFQKSSYNGTRVFGIAGWTLSDTQDVADCFIDEWNDKVSSGSHPKNISTNQCP